MNNNYKLLITFFLFIFLINQNIFAQNIKCSNYINSNWSPIEKKVWNNICSDNVAELKNGKNILSSSFLNTIFTKSKYRNILKDKCIKISNAEFNESVKLDGVDIKALSILNSKFKESVNIKNSNFFQFLSFEESNFSKEFNLSNSDIKKINIYKSNFDGNITMKYLQIKNELNIEKTNMLCNFSLDNSKIYNLIFQNNKFQKTSLITHLQIDNSFVLQKNKYESYLTMSGIEVNKYFLIFNSKFKKNVTFEHIKINNKCQIYKSNFDSNLSIMINNDSDFFIGENKFKFFGTEYSYINKVIFRDNNYTLLSFENSNIDAILYYNSNQNSTKPYIISLENVKLKTLGIDEINMKKNISINLSGIKFKNLKESNFDGKNFSMSKRGIDWYKKVLESNSSNSIQEYRQFSKYFRKVWEHSKADELMYLGVKDYINKLERPKFNNCDIDMLCDINTFFDNVKYFSQLFLWVIVAIIFKGVEYLFWIIIGSIVFGWLVFSKTKFCRYNDDETTIYIKNIGLPFTYSIDKLIPFVTLNKKYEELIPKKENNIFYKIYFYIHQILGYLIISIILTIILQNWNLN